jgi:MFS family permease
VETREVGERKESLLAKLNPARVFFGWWTVIGGGILALWGYGYSAYGISALFKPISEELGFNRTATSVASSIGRFQGGIEAPLTGWITDRWGARWVIFTGISIVSISLILMKFINSLWAYYVVWGVGVATGTNIALSIPMDVTISNWFVKKRGLAISIKWVFSGLSGVVVMPLIALMISLYDWRQTCLIGGIVMAIIGLPISLFLVKSRRPEYYGMLPDGARIAEEVQANRENLVEKGAQYAFEVKEIEFTVRQAMKTIPYWVVFVEQAVNQLFTPVMSIHCIPFLTDPPPGGIGIDPVKAATMMSIWITASLPTRFLGGLIADRIDIKYMRFLITAAFIMQVSGLLAFLHYHSISMIYVWFILYGFGNGLVSTVNPLLRARYFGRKALGSIQGISAMLMTPIGVVAPIYAGWIYDTTGSYMQAFSSFAVALGVATVLSIFVIPPKAPDEITDVRSIV